ncbi:MAG: hypothetical protein KJO07_14470 [Deltaproteobacteria bacterium]|nr:hypothetical protein [Deltaproteobacteria bacterium]
MNRLWIVVVLLVAAGGCGEDFAIEDQPLGGVVGGQTWVYVAGDTNAFLSDERFFASLYASDFEECGFGGPVAGNSLILNLPMEPGSYDLSLSLNMTFVVEDSDGISNLIGTDGLLRIDSVTDTTVSGGIDASYDGDNQINGLFEVAICPDTQ